MVPLEGEASAAVEGAAPAATGAGEGTKLGKRYTAEGVGIEVLCTKAGEGLLTFGDVVLAVKASKPLPSSD